MSAVPETAGQEALVDYLSRRAGLAVGGYRGDVVRRAVARAALDDRPATAIRQLASDQHAFEQLCDDVTVQESYFGREPATFDLLRGRILDELAPTLGTTLRVWSAGCARGEEAYSLAMALAEAGLDGRYRVLGTDLSAAAVSAAREATYGPWALRGLDPGAVLRRFTREGDRFRVRDRFRAHVEFAVHNVLEPLPPQQPFDVIFCRNLLIYLTDEAVELVAARLVSLLAPGGWLVTAAADPILDRTAGLETVRTQHGLAYRRPRRTPPRPAPVDQQAAAPTDPVGPDTEASGPGRVHGPPSGHAAERPRPAEEDPSVLVTEGESALDRARPRTAERLARRALAVAPTLPAAHLLVVNALAQAGALVEAVDSAATAAALCPTDAEIHHVRAAVLLESGQAADAKAAAQRAVFLDPRMIAAHLMLGRASEQLDQHGTARRARRNAERLLSGGRAGR